MHAKLMRTAFLLAGNGSARDGPTAAFGACRGKRCCAVTRKTTAHAHVLTMQKIRPEHSTRSISNIRFVTTTIRSALVGAALEMEDANFEDQNMLHTRELVGAIMRARIIGVSQERLQFLLGLRLSDSACSAESAAKRTPDAYLHAVRLLMPRWIALVYRVLDNYLDFPLALRPELAAEASFVSSGLSASHSTELIEYTLRSIKLRKTLPELRRELVARSALLEDAAFGHADGAVAYYALMFSALYKKAHLDAQP
mmetsp:Transcript_6518/g.17447  ORF Transcript_6518/g.17447 Transcript_6518/m.17447 type:complete len:255 (-) Transcript_6518:113-877(-)